MGIIETYDYTILYPPRALNTSKCPAKVITINLGSSFSLNSNIVPEINLSLLGIGIRYFSLESKSYAITFVSQPIIKMS